MVWRRWVDVVKHDTASQLMESGGSSVDLMTFCVRLSVF